MKQLHEINFITNDLSRCVDKVIVASVTVCVCVFVCLSVCLSVL